MAKGDLTSYKYSGAPATGGTTVKAATPVGTIDYITGIKVSNTSSTVENCLIITIGGIDYPYYVPAKGFVLEGKNDISIPIPAGEAVSARNVTNGGCNLLLIWVREELV